MKGFEEIYEQYFQYVYGYLKGLTADEHLSEELTEETFFKALKAVKGFRGDSDVQTWLCQIAKNSYFTYLKKQGRISYGEDLNIIESKEKNIERLLVDKDIAFRLHQALHDIEEPYKEIFSLRVFGELPYRQIGMLFGKSEHWACVTFHRAKEKIQKRMEDLR